MKRLEELTETENVLLRSTMSRKSTCFQINQVCVGLQPHLTVFDMSAFPREFQDALTIGTEVKGKKGRDWFRN